MSLQLGRGRERLQRVERKSQVAFIKKAMDGAMAVAAHPDAAHAHLFQREAPLVGPAPVIASGDQVMKLQGHRPFVQRATLMPRLRHGLRP
jgi:hypothetical protein|tara:strand:- start:293 stop:565 length:273 start_codon:yes stop_codon:yes gene_type:complete